MTAFQRAFEKLRLIVADVDADRILTAVEAEACAEQAAEIDRLRQDNRAAHASEQILQQQIDAQAKEIDRLRAELAKARTAALTEAASKVDNLLADTPEYGKFVAEFLRGMAAGGDRPDICRCGHTRDRHLEPPGTPICRDCPGDEERSWKHPFTSKGGA